MMQSGVMPLQVKGHEGLLAIAVAKKKKQKKSWNRFSPWSLRREQGPAYALK